jgi:hypothetical protein
MKGERLVAEYDRIQYQVAVGCVAEWVVARLGACRATREDYMEAALADLRFIEEAEQSEHLWIFRDPIAFTASGNVFEALDARPDGSRDWLQADLASAVAAVARYDVMVAVSEMSCDVADEEAEAGEGTPAAGVGRA